MLLLNTSDSSQFGLLTDVVNVDSDVSISVEGTIGHPFHALLHTDLVTALLILVFSALVLVGSAVEIGLQFARHQDDFLGGFVEASSALENPCEGCTEREPPTKRIALYPFQVPICISVGYPTAGQEHRQLFGKRRLVDIESVDDFQHRIDVDPRLEPRGKHHLAITRHSVRCHENEQCSHYRHKRGDEGAASAAMAREKANHCS
jgi:hypothetical protein